MEANELRIGNRLINSKTGRIVTVLEVLTSRILINADPELKVSKTYTAPLSSYKGIPLTSEILEMCGFKKTVSNNWMIMDENLWLSESSEGGYDCSVLHSSNQPSWTVVSNCSYLHQLQNLCFVLRVELEYKHLNKY